MNSHSVNPHDKYTATACRWAVCVFALAAVATGCSPSSTRSAAPHVAAAQSVATPVSLRTTSSAPAPTAAAAVALPTAVATAPRVTGDVLERELGTASDGGYLAYPAQ